MSQAKRKSTSVSLTIASPVRQTSSSSSVRQSSSTLIQPLSNDCRKDHSHSGSYSGAPNGAAPSFTKSLQNMTTTKGQLVVFECRIRAKPPLQVHWYRECDPIVDSADFRILRKKACLSAVPEEVCTLVITEAFPEDSGVFKCIAENEHGAVASSAHLFVYQEPKTLEEIEAVQILPVTQETTKKMPSPHKSQTVKPEFSMPTKSSSSSLQHLMELDHLADYLSPGMQDAEYETLDDFEGVYENSPEPTSSSDWSAHLEDPDFDFQESNTEQQQKYSMNFYQTPTSQRSLDTFESPNMSVTSLPSASSMYQPSVFNYERPKHFIQAQPTCSTNLQPNGTGVAKCTSHPLKQSSIVIHPQNSSRQKHSPSSSSLSSPRSLSSPPFSSTNESAVPACCVSSTSVARGQVSLPHSQSPAAFLSSVLPSHPDNGNSFRAPTTVESTYPKSVFKKTPIPAQQTSDQEIQGSKDALIQDLERKLRLKDNILHNGNQRLTYEERMARRLLGPENAASVFDVQNAENMQDPQKNSENSKLQAHTTQIRSRPSSREEREHGSIQEKCFPPRFLQVPEDAAVEEGRFFRIDFKVSGLPIPDVTWYLNGRPIRPDDFHKLIVSEKGFHSFIFEVVRSHDAGLYECVASNRAGQAKFRLHLDVLEQERRRAPVFIQKPQSQRAFEGESVRMECIVSAIPAPQMLLKRNNEMLQNNTGRISLLQDSTGKICLLIHNVSKKDAGWYTISAVNEAGVETCHARLDVATYANKEVQNTKQLKVRPTFSKYATLNGKGLDMKQAFLPGTEFQHTDYYAGMYESEEL